MSEPQERALHPKTTMRREKRPAEPRKHTNDHKTSKTDRGPPKIRPYTISANEDSVLNTLLFETAAQTPSSAIRKYSQMELGEMRNDLFKSMGLAFVWTRHQCGHVYCVKLNSQKFHHILQTRNAFVKNGCSVCWKLQNSPYELAEPFRVHINTYARLLNAELENEPILLSHQKLELERVFYTWLYYEQYDKALLTKLYNAYDVDHYNYGRTDTCAPSETACADGFCEQSECLRHY